MTLPCSGCKTECTSELLGTYLLVLIGPASVVLTYSVASASPFEALALVALAFGTTVASVIILLGRRSGAHINPAISLANGLAGIFNRRLFLPYVAFQVAGGLLAGLTLKAVFGSFSSFAVLGSTRLAAGVTPVEGIALEAGGTFVLAFAALSASSFVRTPLRQGIFVGATLFFLIIAIGPLTGASFNPARSLGPSVFSGYFGGQFVYWIGPLAGGGCAGLIFRTLRKTHGQTERLSTVCLC